MRRHALAGLIDHVVIVVKENHTFDNYFGSFPGADGQKLPRAQDPPPGDPDHRHQAWMSRLTDTRHKVEYIEADIPQYFALARQYTLCDRFFSEVAGPSTPNHLMLITADSPVINNPAGHNKPGKKNAYQLKSLPAALAKAGVTWGNFGGYAFEFVAELAGSPNHHTTDEFAKLAAKGTLPQVSWLYAEGTPSLSEHPPQVVTKGAAWTAQQIQALVTGGLWSRTAVFITWDDWGGWFDHVVPPNKEAWDPAKAQRPADAFPQFKGQQFRYGSRVPCLVVSPYARVGHVSSTERSHISLVKFCQTLFGIASINPRLQNADDMVDCFDPAQQPLPAPAFARSRRARQVAAHRKRRLLPT